jgi:homoserine kinase type II
MMDEIDLLRPVLQAYREILFLQTCTPLSSSCGFSGARLWRIRGAGGEFCLRRWPAEHPDEARLQFIHAALRKVYERGVREVAVPLGAAGGATWIQHDGSRWELTRWMPGRADFHDDPRAEKLRAALAWLAKFHLAAATENPGFGASPGITERRQLLHRMHAGEAAEIARSLPALPWPEFIERGQRILQTFSHRAPAVERMLAEAQPVVVGLQPCIRDIWHDHILFDGERVSGVVDFGAMRNESVASDIARLLGSLVADDSYLRRIGLEAYCEARPLSEHEQRLLPVFDASEVLLSGMNWLRWICLEGRQFDQPQRVLVRLDEILLRIERPPGILVE